MHCGHGGFLAAKHLSSFSQSEHQHSDELASIQKMYWPNLMATDMISCYQWTYAFSYCEVVFFLNLQDFGCVEKAVGCEGFVWNSPDFGSVEKAVGCECFVRNSPDFGSVEKAVACVANMATTLPTVCAEYYL